MAYGGGVRVAFFGEDAFSCVVLKSLIYAGYNVPLVVTPHYENMVYKRLERVCNNFGIELYRTKKINTEDTLAKLKGVSPDLCVIAHFERLIKKPLLDVPPMGFINLHPSLLPNYRGMSPQHWPIVKEEKETGITIHYVDESADTGDIIVQRHIGLDSGMYVSDLQKVWIREYHTVMLEAIDNVIKGRKPRRQSHLKGSYYGKLTDEECMIPRDATVETAYAMVRGLSLPYHGAQYANVIIYKAHICDDEAFVSKVLPEGLYIHTDAPSYIKFKNGILILDSYKQL